MVVNIQGGSGVQSVEGGIVTLNQGASYTFSANQGFGVAPAVVAIMNIAPQVNVVGSSSSRTLCINISPSTDTFITTAQTGDIAINTLGIITLANPSSGTIANASTFVITGAPAQGTNTTITTARSVWVKAGTTAIDGNLTLKSGSTITNYNGIATAGAGVPIIVASAITGSVTTTQTNLLNYTPPASTGTYRMNIFISNTSGTNTGTWTPAIAYKSGGGQSSYAPNFEQSGTLTYILAPTGASKDFYASFTFGIDNSATAITLTLTVSGTVASFINATLEQLA